MVNSFKLILFSIALLASAPLLSAEEMDHSQHMKYGETMQQSEQMEHSGQNMHEDHSAHTSHQEHQGHHGMTLDLEGMVMNTNDSELPKDCSAISREYRITVKAGTHFSHDYPGTIFGLDKHEIQVEPCSKIHVTFINEDEVRHQWMVHGLPKYIYDKGMFHLEAAGGSQKSGTFIIPSDDKTYLVHCDISQHMEKGMKAQLVAGKGNGDLPSIPGISGPWLAP